MRELIFMFKRLFIFSFVMFLVITQPSQAQNTIGNKELVDSSIKDLIIVGGTGSMGAILGLSTLSFVDEPSEHLKNVYMGASIGIIIGVSFVAYQTANREQENLVRAKKISPSFSTVNRLAWHYSSHRSNQKDIQKNQILNLNFNF